MNLDQPDFDGIRIGETFRQNAKAYKKVCERTAMPFVELADGSRQYSSAVCFYAEERVDRHEDTLPDRDGSQLSDEEFDFLVQVAQIPPEGRAAAAGARRDGRKALSSCARDILELLTGARSDSMAAKAWLGLINRAAGGHGASGM